MSEKSNKNLNKLSRTRRTRSTIHGTEQRPRLSVNVSNLHVSAQIINDDNHQTLAYASSVALKSKDNLTKKAELVGEHIAKDAKAKKITKVVFDRGGKQYHGRIKALAEAARKNGLEF